MAHDGGQPDDRPCSTLATWPAGTFVESIAVDPAGDLFVAFHGDRLVVRVDPDTGTTTTLVEMPAPVAGLVFGRDGALYASGGRIGEPPGFV